MQLDARQTDEGQPRSAVVPSQWEFPSAGLSWRHWSHWRYAWRSTGAVLPSAGRAHKARARANATFPREMTSPVGFCYYSARFSRIKVCAQFVVIEARGLFLTWCWTQTLRTSDIEYYYHPSYDSDSRLCMGWDCIRPVSGGYYSFIVTIFKCGTGSLYLRPVYSL